MASNVRVFAPTKADTIPAGPDWMHEIKYDGYRMMPIRDQGRVRLISLARPRLG